MINILEIQEYLTIENIRDNNYLLLLYCWAFFSFFLVVLLPKKKRMLRWISTILFTVSGALNGLLLIHFDFSGPSEQSGFSILEVKEILFGNLYFHDMTYPMTASVNGISIIYLLLTTVILFSCNASYFYRLSIGTEEEHKAKRFVVWLFAIQIASIFIFSFNELIVFFIIYESSILPLYWMIESFGPRPNNLHAAKMMLYYTLMSGVPMLLFIVYVHFSYGYSGIEEIEMSSPEILALFAFFGFFSATLAFFVKIPIYPGHAWLPEAHVEGSTETSVILAALVLKYGFYGFIMIGIKTYPTLAYMFSPILSSICLISAIYAALQAIRQDDIKRIIAYTSINHMSLSTVFILTGIQNAIVAGIFLAIVHTVVSGMAFHIAGMVSKRTGSRAIIHNQGISYRSPVFGVLILIVGLANIAFPLTAPFLAEIVGMLAITSRFNLLILSVIALSSVLVSVYIIWLSTRLLFGPPKLDSIRVDITTEEFYIILPLISSVLVCGLYPNSILPYIQHFVQNSLFFFC